MAQYLDDGGCLNIQGTTVVKCFDDLIPVGGYVKIPEGVTSIGGHAFDGCKSLTSVTIPDSVTSIGDNAFNGCWYLTSVTIHEGVRSIGESAFGRCGNLDVVALPRSVRRIEDYAFYGCECPTVYYAGKEVDWRRISQGESVFEPGARVQYNWQGPAPVSKKSMGRTDLTSVVIPDGTTEILAGEYEDCKNLRSVTIPEGVTDIGQLAFSGCKSLTSVTIPEGVTDIGQLAFYGCKNLKAVALPRSVRKIMWQAFIGCKCLTVYYAGKEVNWRCIDREEILNLCSGIERSPVFEPGTRIQYNWQGPAPGDVARERPPKKQAAGGTTSGSVPRQDTAQRQKPPKKPAGGGTARGAGGFDLTHMTIPDGTTEIRPYAFMGCATLESVVIPGSVTKIGENAFAGCSRLASVTFSKGVAHIGTDAFSGCPLKEVHYGGGKDEWLAITGDRPRSKGIKVNLYPKGLPS